MFCQWTQKHALVLFIISVVEKKIYLNLTDWGRVCAMKQDPRQLLRYLEVQCRTFGITTHINLHLSLWQNIGLPRSKQHLSTKSMCLIIMFDSLRSGFIRDIWCLCSWKQKLIILIYNKNRRLDKMLSILSSTHPPLSCSFSRQRSDRLLSQFCSTNRLKNYFSPLAIQLHNTSLAGGALSGSPPGHPTKCCKWTLQSVAF